MPTLVEDIQTSAAWIAKALASSGYLADFSLTSLREIDRFFDEHSRNGEAVPSGLLAEKLGAKMFAFGAYVGEVIRRVHGGHWQADDQDPQGEMNITLILPTGGLIWPAQRIMKLFKNGAEDSVWAYGIAMGTAPGASSQSQPKKSWWKLW